MYLKKNMYPIIAKLVFYKSVYNTKSKYIHFFYRQYKLINCTQKNLLFMGDS